MSAQGADKVNIGVGGVAYQTATCLSTLGIKARLLTAWADSDLSRLLGQHISGNGIELMADEVPDMETGATVNHAAEGRDETVLASAIPISQYNFHPSRIRYALNGVDAVYLDATLSPATMISMASHANKSQVPVVAIGVTPAFSQDLLGLEGLLTALVVTPEQSEQVMQRIGVADPSEAAQRLDTMIFVVRAERGAVIYRPDTERMRLVPPTSADGKTLPGDLFAVCVIAGMIRGEPLEVAANHAMRMAAHLVACLLDSNGLTHVVRGLVDKADRDKLTGLLTRGGFTDNMRKAQYESGSILVVDLDNFKQVNDTKGHDEGDRVLVDTADILRTCTRTADLICRWGGDEFVVFLPHTEPRRARQVANRMRAMAEERANGVTLSIGVVAGLKGEMLVEGVKRADQAMYRAKRGGKNCIEVESPIPRESAPVEVAA